MYEHFSNVLYTAQKLIWSIQPFAATTMLNLEPSLNGWV